jgi:hypothetical protein
LRIPKAQIKEILNPQASNPKKYSNIKRIKRREGRGGVIRSGI